MNKIDGVDIDAVHRRPWHVPGAHERYKIFGNTFVDKPDCGVMVGSLEHADDYEDALADVEPIPTAPGELDETKRGVEAANGLFVALVLVAWIAVCVLWVHWLSRL